MKALSFFWVLLLFMSPFNSESQNIVNKPNLELINLDTLEVSSLPEVLEYKPSRKITSKITHARLEIKPSFKDKRIYANAQLTLVPQYYPISQVELDARGMDIKQTYLLTEGSFTPVQFTYDSLILKIYLGKTFNRNQQFTLLVDYVANPYELEKRNAIPSSGKGVYFIDPYNTNPYKPTQVWTQNQTESASCWFPIIDAPNVRFKQEMFITVPKHYLTLSNGKLISTKINGDGTKTDYWKQSETHPSYLAMFAAGEFEVVKDSWKNINVDYYTESGYENWVKEVFKSTPSMMMYFSDLLKYDFPWEKYHQIVVRDFVAGAMENTSASVFYEHLLQDANQLSYTNHEAIIAHELFHQWFGDLVTCESWSNLTLNESMATYAEYLWNEFHNGESYSAYYFYLDRQKYFRETFLKQEPLINYYYKDTEDLFDAHRYEKGAWVLHMLRNYLGDELFFEGLNEYLNTYKFGSVEIHQLRLVYERLSGEDLNWFFNQWYLSKGHPVLNIESNFKKEASSLQIQVQQTNDTSGIPFFVFPLEVNIYTNKGVKKESIWIDSKIKSFSIPLVERPLAIVFNENNGVLCEITENKSIEDYIAQLKYAKGIITKFDAIEKLIISNQKEAREALLNELSNENWFVRKHVLEKMDLIYQDEEIEKIVKEIALKDDNTKVRFAAINYLTESEYDCYYLAKQLLDSDSSYIIVAKCIEIITKNNYNEALIIAEEYSIKLNNPINRVKASLYAETGSPLHASSFKDIIWNTWFRGLNPILNSYVIYLSKTDFATFENGIKFLQSFYFDEVEQGYRIRIVKAINDLETLVLEQKNNAKKLIKIRDFKSKIGL